MTLDDVQRAMRKQSTIFQETFEVKWMMLKMMLIAMTVQAEKNLACSILRSFEAIP
jgi:hypothetical protein